MSNDEKMKKLLNKHSLAETQKQADEIRKEIMELSDAMQNRDFNSWDSAHS